MSDLAWLGAAFAIAWLAIGAYLVRLWRAQAEIGRRLEELTKARNDRPLGGPAE